MAKNQNIKNPPYPALDIIGVMICSKFQNYQATLWLAIYVPVGNWGLDFGNFPTYFAENARVVAYFIASYLENWAELMGKLAHSGN